MSIQSVRSVSRLVGPGRRPFVIAEACINHEGKFEIDEQIV